MPRLIPRLAAAFGYFIIHSVTDGNPFQMLVPTGTLPSMMITAASRRQRASLFLALKALKDAEVTKNASNEYMVAPSGN